MDRPRFVYVTYIQSTAEKVFEAIRDPKMTRAYWHHDNVSDWKPGSKWEHRTADDERRLKLLGKVVEVDPPRKLVITWAFPADEASPAKHSRVTFDIEPVRGVVKLTITHADLEPGSEMQDAITRGWPIVLSSLKTYLETGRALPKLW
jgi:uncharacterized protein YndB with AHSA1/START domain